MPLQINKSATIKLALVIQVSLLLIVISKYAKEIHSFLGVIKHLNFWGDAKKLIGLLFDPQPNRQLTQGPE